MTPSSPFPSSGDPRGSSPVPQGSGPTAPGRGPNAIVWRWWNLLLLLPLLMLITPWFNKNRPHVLGLPFFYWYQLIFVFVGVACVAIVYAATKTAPSRELPPSIAASIPEHGGTAGGRHAAGKTIPAREASSEES